MRVLPRPRPTSAARSAGQPYARWTPYLFLLPYLLVFLLFRLGPSIFGLAMSFTKWSIVGSPEWIGARNYELMQIDPRLDSALKNTVFFTGLTVPLLVIASLALAIFLSQPRRGRALGRLAAFRPMSSCQQSLACCGHGCWRKTSVWSTSILGNWVLAGCLT